MTKREILSSTTFYNTIAEDYNHYLLLESDKTIRQHVEKTVTEKVPSGIVMDFGGGTGLDLDWSLKHYHIYFLEPSEKMRAIAKKKYADNNGRIHFLEDQLDFTKWTPQTKPVDKMVDGIMANFAVLNCIEDISLLFDKLALLLKPGGYIVATVLDSQFNTIRKTYSWRKAFESIFHKIKISSNYKGTGHTTYLHKLGEYKRYARNDFDFVHYQFLGISDFGLLVFRKR